MTDTIVRLRSGKLTFETVVDLENTLKLKKGEKVDMANVIRDNEVYLDQKKGMRAGSAELKNVFGTTEFQKIVEQIIKKGNLEITQEFREEALETRKKQVIDFLSKNSVDSRTGRSFTSDILERAIREAGIRIENQPVERQISSIVEKLRVIIPIKIETKKIKIKIPASYAGKTYGLIKDYKEKEEWLANGDLEVFLNIPSGLQMEFYDKLNAITHGSTVSEEIK